jgi:hypothetical protein
VTGIETTHTCDSTLRGSRTRAGLFVWIVFAVFVIGALYYSYTTTLVPFTDRDTLSWPQIINGQTWPSFTWFWQFHNEHRILVPKLTITCMSRLTEHNTRAITAVSTLCLAGAALLALLTMRRLRGHWAFIDAIFPVLYLNWAQTSTLTCQIQLTSGLSALLFHAFVYLTMSREGKHEVRFLLPAGIMLVLMPVGCGGMLLPSAAAFAVVFIVLAGRLLRKEKNHLAASVCAFFGVATVLLLLDYFLDYKGRGIQVGGLAMLDGTLQIVSLLFGRSFVVTAYFFLGLSVAAAGILLVFSYCRDRLPSPGAPAASFLFSFGVTFVVVSVLSGVLAMGGFLLLGSLGTGAGTSFPTPQQLLGSGSAALSGILGRIRGNPYSLSAHPVLSLFVLCSSLCVGVWLFRVVAKKGDRAMDALLFLCGLASLVAVAMLISGSRMAVTKTGYILGHRHSPIMCPLAMLIVGGMEIARRRSENSLIGNAFWFLVLLSILPNFGIGAWYMKHQSARNALILQDARAGLPVDRMGNRHALFRADREIVERSIDTYAFFADRKLNIYRGAPEPRPSPREDFLRAGETLLDIAGNDLSRMTPLTDDANVVSATTGREGFIVHAKQTPIRFLLPDLNTSERGALFARITLQSPGNTKLEVHRLDEIEENGDDKVAHVDVYDGWNVVYVRLRQQQSDR